MGSLKHAISAFQELNIYGLEQALAMRSVISDVPKKIFIEKMDEIFRDHMSQIIDFKAHRLVGEEYAEDELAYCFINSIRYAYLSIVIKFDAYGDVLDIRDNSKIMTWSEDYQFEEPLDYELDTLYISDFLFYEDDKVGYEERLYEEDRARCKKALSELSLAQYFDNLNLQSMREWVQNFKSLHNDKCWAHTRKIFRYREQISRIIDFYEEIEKFSQYEAISKDLCKAFREIHPEDKRAGRLWYQRVRKEIPDMFSFYFFCRDVKYDESYIYLDNYKISTEGLTNLLCVLEQYRKFLN